MISCHTLVGPYHPCVSLGSGKSALTHSPVLDNLQLPWVNEGLGTH